MRANRIRLIATLLLEVLLLTACNSSRTSETASAPELIEPAAANASYRPVELGMIGEPEVLYGTVVPMEYCQFYDTNVNIERLLVEVGDYVKEGDVIAYADIETAQKEVKELQLQLENLEQNFERNYEIAQLQIGQIVLQEMPVQNELDSNVSGNDISIDSVSDNKLSEEKKAWQQRKDAAIATGLENLRYDAMLHEYRVEQLQAQMERKQRVVDEGVLKASHSGYVVYVKELSQSTYAMEYENIVILSDSQELYLELEKTLDNYAYKDYEVKYIQLAGQIHEVTEFSYGIDAEIFAKASKKYPNVRLHCSEMSQLLPGETYPVYFREKASEKLPIIGLDSLEGEKDAYYVYVKGENGEREKRFVTIGDSDKYYAQVLSGVEPGELVYYESEARMPAEYTEYPVSLSDYEMKNLTQTFQFADARGTWYEAGCNGTIVNVAVKAGEEVKAGDLLFEVRSEAGKAALAAALNDINRENTTFEKSIEQISDRLAKETDEIEMRILTLRKELAEINHSYRLQQLEEVYREMQSNNDGEGKVAVYAKNSGRVVRISAGKEDVVGERSQVLCIRGKEDDKLLVEMTKIEEGTNYPSNIASSGEQIAITVRSNEVFTGKCIGRTAHSGTNEKKYYITGTESGTAISFCTSSGYDKPAFYVEMEDESFYERMSQGMSKGTVEFDYIAMEDVVLVPTSMVMEEKNAQNPARTDYFMWRVEGDELVKQYVLIDQAYSDMNYTLILWGVEENDVLAKEK